MRETEKEREGARERCLDELHRSLVGKPALHTELRFVYRPLFTHFQVLVHQSVSIHGLQVPVFVPLRQLRFVLHVGTGTAPFLHLPARPPVLQQAEHRVGGFSVAS